MSEEILRNRLKQRVQRTVDQYRSLILDPVEQEIGGTIHWPYIRRRLLKALGDRGLAKQIENIIDEEFSSNESCK